MKFIWEKCLTVLTIFAMILAVIPASILENTLLAEGVKNSSSLEIGVVAIAYLLTGCFYLFYAYKKEWLKRDKALISKETLLLIFGGYGVMWLCDQLGLHWLQLMGQNNTVNQAALDRDFAGYPAVLLVAMLVFCYPIMEELIFRGFFVKRFFKAHPLWGYLVGSTLFAFSHTPTDIPSFLIYFSSGLIFAFVYYKSDNLAVPIALHLLNNGVAFLLSGM